MLEKEVFLELLQPTYLSLEKIKVKQRDTKHLDQAPCPWVQWPAEAQSEAEHTDRSPSQS